MFNKLILLFVLSICPLFATPFSLIPIVGEHKSLKEYRESLLFVKNNLLELKEDTLAIQRNMLSKELSQKNGLNFEDKEGVLKELSEAISRQKINYQWALEDYQKNLSEQNKKSLDENQILLYSLISKKLDKSYEYFQTQKLLQKGLQIRRAQLASVQVREYSYLQQFHKIKKEIKIKEQEHLRMIKLARRNGLREGRGRGREHGVRIGKNDALHMASQKGEQVGKELAEVSGRLSGFIKGKLEGKEQMNAPLKANDAELTKESLFEEAKRIGRSDAIVKARRVDFFRGLQEEKMGLFKKNSKEDLEIESIVIDNQETSFTDLEDVLSFVMKVPSEGMRGSDLSEKEMAVSASEFIQHSMQNSLLDSNIEELEVKFSLLNQGPSIEELYQAPKRVSTFLETNDCSKKFKEHEYIRECEKSYFNSFDQNYMQGHKESFFEYYLPQFDNYKEKYKNKFKEAYFPEGYKYAFNLSQNEARSKTLISLNREIFEKAHQEGFSEEIGMAKRRAYEAGAVAARHYFAQNGIIRFQEAQHKIEMFKGRDFTLSLNLQNLGKKASLRGETTVSIRALSDNIEFERKQIALSSMPGKKRIELKNIVQGKVLKKAHVGSPIKVEVILLTKGPRVQYVDKVILEGEVRQN